MLKQTILVADFNPVESFQMVLEAQGWKIGIMHNSDEWYASGITQLQRHETCDEAFVLLKGHCYLLTMENDSNSIQGFEMQQQKLYTIPKGIWHSHIVDSGAEVLVVESNDVALENSPFLELTEDQKKQIALIQQNR